MSTPPIQMAVQAAGSQMALAKAIGAAPQFVSQWVTGRRPVPPKFALAIARIYRVSQHDLRPDVFGPAPKKKRTPKAA
ncbi:YdaS family helix-turn-helix protein [Stenotrophomonas geniculata]